MLLIHSQTCDSLRWCPARLEFPCFHDCQRFTAGPDMSRRSHVSFCSSRASSICPHGIRSCTKSRCVRATQDGTMKNLLGNVWTIAASEQLDVAGSIHCTQNTRELFSIQSMACWPFKRLNASSPVLEWSTQLLIAQNVQKGLWPPDCNVCCQQRRQIDSRRQ